ncbi:unnamed protein product [Meloidogyne enterolobii]|uniref:Aminoacyl-tRNA synthetase class II (D/K/N) domain-containing protein n=2 Tax=Meloidogyne enterolobii TaxID=390850 RepID=A0A6V7X1E8_MELEN|nr:unnamed protein product [Meloidogyne enterolobii]
MEKEKQGEILNLKEEMWVEAECPFITFEELMNKIEDLVSDVVERVFSDPEISELISQRWETSKEKFFSLKRPFLQMTYSDAIEWLRKNNVNNEEGKPSKFGEDILEEPKKTSRTILVLIFKKWSMTTQIKSLAVLDVLSS